MVLQDLFLPGKLQQMNMKMMQCDEHENLRYRQHQSSTECMQSVDGKILYKTFLLNSTWNNYGQEEVSEARGLLTQNMHGFLQIGMAVGGRSLCNFCSIGP